MSEPAEIDEIEASRAPLMDHLLELRTRLVVSVVAVAVASAVCFAFADRIFEWLLGGYRQAVITVAKDPNAWKATEIIFTNPLEFFIVKLKIAMLGGLCAAFPVVAFQMYRFVAPGLYYRERSAFLPFLVAAPLLFALGIALVQFMVMPMVMQFSLSQQLDASMTGGATVKLVPKVQDYFELVTTLMFSFGLAFQLPIVLTIGGMAGFVSAKMLREGRRFALLAVFVFAAIITPPDVISQVSLAAPLYILYEISILAVALIETGRKKEDDARAAMDEA